MPYLLKGCLHCGGDLCESWDFFDGFYSSCLQCGRHCAARPVAGRTRARLHATASRRRHPV